MPLNVSCSCGKSFAVKDEFAGHQVRCVCGQVLTIPAASKASRASSPPTQPNRPAPPRTRARPPQPSQEELPLLEQLPDDEPASKGGGKGVLIAIIVLAVLGGGGAAVGLNWKHIRGWFSKDDPTPIVQNEKKTDEKKTDIPTPVEKRDEKKTDPQPDDKKSDPKPPPDDKKGDPVPPPDDKKGDPKPPPDDKKTDPKPPDGPLPLNAFKGHSSPVLKVGYSKDGSLVLSASGDFKDGPLGAMPAADCTVRTWDARTGAPKLSRTGFSQGIAAAAFSPDGRFALLTGAGKKLDSGWTAGADVEFRLLDVQDDKEVRPFTGHLKEILSIAFSSDGLTAVSGGRDRIVRVWEVEKGTELNRLVGHEDSINCVAISPDGVQILSAGSDQSVRLWDLKKGTEIKKLVGHKDTVWAVAFSPDGKHAVSAGGYQLGPDGKALVPGNKDFTLRLWDLNEGKEVRTFEGHTEAVLCVAFSPDGKRVISGGVDGSVRLWNVGTGREMRRYTGHVGTVHSVAVAPDGKRTISGGKDGAINSWDMPLELPELVKAFRATTDRAARVKLVEELGEHGPDARPLFGDLLSLLKESDDAERKVVLTALDRIGKLEPKDLPALLPLSRQAKAPGVRRYAVEALGRMGPDAMPALDSLVDALSDADATVRAAAAVAVGQLGPPAKAKAHPLLIKGLRDADAEFAKASAEALEKLGPPEVGDLPKLREMLGDTSEVVRRYAIGSVAGLKAQASAATPELVAMATRDTSAELRRRALGALPVVAPKAKETLETLTKAVADPDEVVALMAVEGLAPLGAEGGALPGLLRALDNPAEKVWKTAEEAFGKVTLDRTHARTLGDALGTAKQPSRERILAALGNLGPGAADALPSLRALLRRAGGAEAVKVVQVLGKMGPDAKEAGPELLPLLARKADMPEDTLWIEAAMVLVQIKAPEVNQAIPLLIGGLLVEKDEAEPADLERCEKISKVLVKMGKSVADPLGDALLKEFFVGNLKLKDGLYRAVARLRVIKILEEIGPEANTPKVMQALVKLVREDLPANRQAANEARMKLLK